MIGLICYFYNKYNNLAFEINNKILDLLLCDIVFLVID